jgi:hypothetical protein
MRMSRSSKMASRVLVLLCCACGSNSTAGKPARAAATAGAESPTDPDPMTCRREMVPGHRVSQRVCRRESEIRAQREATQSYLRQTRPQATPSPEARMDGM